MSYPTQAQGAQGTILKRGNGATPTESFTAIAEIANFNGPTEKAKAIDVTNTDSAAKEFIPGLEDPGDVSLEGNWIAKDAQQQGLRSDLVTRTKRNFQLVYPDTTTVTFAAVVTEFAVKGAADDKLSLTCTLKVSGVPTIQYAP